MVMGIETLFVHSYLIPGCVMAAVAGISRITTLSQGRQVWLLGYVVHAVEFDAPWLLFRGSLLLLNFFFFFIRVLLHHAAVDVRQVVLLRHSKFRQVGLFASTAPPGPRG